MTIKPVYRDGRPVPGVYDIYVKFGPNNKDRFRKRKKFADETEAQAFENIVRKQLGLEAKKPSPYNINAIATLYKAWMVNQIVGKNDKPRMLDNYVLPYFGEFFPDVLTSQMITAYKEKRLAMALNKAIVVARKKGLPIPGKKFIPREINLELQCLGSMIEWGRHKNRPAVKNYHSILKCFLTSARSRWLPHAMKSMRSSMPRLTCFTRAFSPRCTKPVCAQMKPAGSARMTSTSTMK